MREIKFRAWDKKEKKMYQSNEFKGFMDLEGSIIRLAFGKSPGIIYDYMDDRKERYLPLQSTNLHDKNGKEIYEGDIIKHTNETYVVEWSDKGWWIRGISNPDHYSGWSNNMYEIIGSIYENPELLEGEKK